MVFSSTNSVAECLDILNSLNSHLLNSGNFLLVMARLTSGLALHPNQRVVLYLLPFLQDLSSSSVESLSQASPCSRGPALPKHTCTHFSTRQSVPGRLSSLCQAFLPLLGSLACNVPIRGACGSHTICQSQRFPVSSDSLAPHSLFLASISSHTDRGPSHGPCSLLTFPPLLRLGHLTIPAAF